MKWSSDYRMRLMLVGIVIAILLGGGRAKADFIFGEPTLFEEPVNSTGVEYFDCISADGLEIYIDKPVGGGIASPHWDMYVSTRGSINDPWSVPVNLGPIVNTSGVIDCYASLSSDDLELYFAGKRPGGYGSSDIWVTTRDSKAADWGTPVNLGATVNTSYQDWLPWISSNGLELYFSSERPGGYGGSDIWVATRTTTNDEWEEPVNLGPIVNSTISDCHPCLSPDGLVLFFSDYDNPSSGFRPGGHGQSDMWMTRRKSTADPWGEPVNLGPSINTSYYESSPRPSPDGSVLYFTSSRPGKIGGFSDIWQAQILPIVDLNGDGIVDSSDMCIMIDRWGESYSLCDIGPTPLGDGIVDIEDLIVLAEHLLEDVNDPTLVAHWALDETEGGIAYNSAADCDGILVGDPVWQREGGMVAGALRFDGINDYVSADFVLNPADGVFSVLAWVMGGAPGQVVISQEGGSDWVTTDAEGKLITGLSNGGRSSVGPMLSQTNVPDGNWHRIGFVWDGLYRHLYVDGIEVAADVEPLTALEGSGGGLYLGAGSDLAPGTFFSGLIDDVRIYNRAVSP